MIGMIQSRWITYSIFALGLCASIFTNAAARTPPLTRTDNISEVLHGVEIVDPYRWLEDQNSPETREWITLQKDYTQSVIGSIPGREKLKQQIADLMKTATVAAPLARAGRYFFEQRPAEQDLKVIYMREGLRGKDEVLVDPHPLSPDHTISVNLLDVSSDGSFLAYGIRDGGEDEITVRVLDIDKRMDLTDQLPKGRYYDVCLEPDGAGFYYAHHTDKGPRVYYHAMGTDLEEDAQLFGDGYGLEKIITIDLSDDGNYLLATVWHGSASRSEIYCLDLAVGGELIPIVNDVDAKFEGHIGGDIVFLQTDWEAPAGRIMAVDLAHPDRDQWQEVIPETHAVIKNFSIAGQKVLVTFLDNVVTSLKVFETNGNLAATVDLPSIGSVSRIKGQWQSSEIFFSFSSFHIPTTIYRYDLGSATQDVWAQIEIPIESENFQTKQVWLESSDYTEVPMFIVHAKDMEYDGTNPTLLTGYGGFRGSMTPRFSERAALWVEKGGVYAIPNLRGGGEFGEEWHRAGMLENKQNTFDDFIAAAAWLIENKYTNPNKLAISGTSNGGLLVGAALTQRPELFGAVTCGYPLLDMLRYDKFLVAKFWVPEYGSAEDPEQFSYIYDYSPYHRVEQGTKYPAVMFITGDADTRVDPLHARKMAARLQAGTASDRPVLLHYDTTAGHSGGRPLTKRIDDMTDQLLFLFWQLDVDF